MKNKIFFYVSTLLLLIAFSFPNEVNAQRRKVIKRHRVVKVNHRGHSRPLKVRRVAHVRYRHLPRRGKVIRTLAVGHISIRHSGIHYRFHRGVWYQPRGKKFVVVRAPFGVRIRTLPTGYRRIIIGSRPYFYYYGTFYVKTSDPETEYEVIDAPIGAEIDALPDGYKVVVVDDYEYYLLDNTYYEARINDNDEEYYIVVKDPNK